MNRATAESRFADIYNWLLWRFAIVRCWKSCLSLNDEQWINSEKNKRILLPTNCNFKTKMQIIQIAPIGPFSLCSLYAEPCDPSAAMVFTPPLCPGLFVLRLDNFALRPCDGPRKDTCGSLSLAKTRHVSAFILYLSFLCPMRLFL